jgi:hypothetical protein
MSSAITTTMFGRTGHRDAPSPGGRAASGDAGQPATTKAATHAQSR